MGMKWKEDYSIETQRCFGIAIGFVCGLLCLALFELLRGLDVSWPAWIQAIGSVIAIVAAIFVARFQSNESREMLQEQWVRNDQAEIEYRKMKLRSIANVWDRCATAAIQVCGALSGNWADYALMLTSQKLKLKAVESWLSEMPIENDPGILISGDFANLKLKIAQINDIAERLGQSHLLSNSDRAKMRDIVELITSNQESVNLFADEYNGEFKIPRLPEL